MAPSDNYIDSYDHLLVNSGFIFTYLVEFSILVRLYFYMYNYLSKKIFDFFRSDVTA